MREEAFGSVQPLEYAETRLMLNVANVVPAPMREAADESDQPLDSAGTYRMATMRVPAPRLELGKEGFSDGAPDGFAEGLFDNEGGIVGSPTVFKTS